jgi:hypothetical protein
MTRYIKKTLEDASEGGMEATKLQRGQRKSRSHKLTLGFGDNRREGRSGWAYAKRRNAIV